VTEKPSLTRSEALRRLHALKVRYADLPAELRADPDFFRSALTPPGLDEDDPEFMESLFWEWAIPEVISGAPAHLLDDLDLMRGIAGTCPDLLEHLPAPLRDDRDLVLAGVRLNGRQLEHASDRMRDDPEQVREAILQDGRQLEHASERLRADPDLVRAAIGRDPSAIRFADPALRDDRDLVLLAVSIDGSQLEHASERLRSDPDLVRVALGLNGRALPHAAPALRDDRDLVLAAVRLDGRQLGHASERLRADPELVREAVLKDWRALPFAAPALQGEEELVRLALNGLERDLHDGKDSFFEISHGGLIELLERVPVPFWSDPDLVRLAVTRFGGLLKYANLGFRSDPDLARTAVRDFPEALAFVEGAPRRDPDLIRDAVIRDPFALIHVLPEDRDRALSDPAVRAAVDQLISRRFGAPPGSLPPMSRVEERRARRHVRRLLQLLDRTPPVAGLEVRFGPEDSIFGQAHMGLLLEERTPEGRIRHVRVRTACGALLMTVRDRAVTGGGAFREIRFRSDHETRLRQSEHLCTFMKLAIRRATTGEREGCACQACQSDEERIGLLCRG
jgi:hypothetical protein